MALHLLASSVLLGLVVGAPAFDDSSVLIQRQQRPSPRICTPEEVADFQARQKAFRDRAEAKKMRIENQIKDKFRSYLSAGKNRGAEFLTPVLDAVEVVAQYLDDQVAPVGLHLVKGILQQALKGPGPLLPESKMIAVNRTAKDFVAEWERAHFVHIKALLRDAFVQMNGDIDSALEAKTRERAQALVPRGAPYPIHNGTELGQYIERKALPVLAASSFPDMEEIAEILTRQPAAAPEVSAWVVKEVVPFLVKKLPEKCRPQRLATTLGLGMGDVGSRIGKFVSNCKTSLGLVPEVSLAGAPQLKCSTCAENYKWSAVDGGNPGSCMSHCSAAVAACAPGVTNDCVHKWTPCLRCHKKMLGKLDLCRGTEDAAPLVTLLGKLEQVFKTGTVEKDGVEKFADALLDTVGVPM